MERISLRDKIRGELVTNKKIVLSGEVVRQPKYDTLSWLIPGDKTVELVDFYIPPVKAIKRAYPNRLRELMKNIISYQYSEGHYSSRSYSSSYLHVGHLGVSELVGIKNVSSKLFIWGQDQEPDPSDAESPEMGSNLFRKINIIPFPNAFLARVISSYESEKARTGEEMPEIEEMIGRNYDDTIQGIDLLAANSLHEGFQRMLKPLINLH